MSIQAHSLLDDPLISLRGMDGVVKGATLPDVLAALAQCDVLAFEALQPHQQQAWHSFLVQVGAMSVARASGPDLPRDAAAWRDMLVALSGGSEAAWHLVVEDVSQPAFMQPPVPEGSLEQAKYKTDVPTPDQLDVLITSKNHDVKVQRISRPRPEHWLVALLTLQTMEGFLGRGNYGIVRMNGGFGNRPMVGLTRGLTWGERFKRDVEALLVVREDASRHYDPYDPRGRALLWVEPWDGGKKSGIPLESCDPYFLEVCRRIRFTEEDGQLVCWRTNTDSQRVAAPDALKGATGDPWTPIDKVEAKALTVGESGFTYRLLQQIFLQAGDYSRPPALEFQENERNGAFLIARTLVRGQGKTDGLHHRIVPVSKTVSGRLFRDPSERERLAALAQQRVECAADVQRKVLYPSLAALVSSGRDEKVDWERVASWIDAFDRAVDARFFDSLWASVEINDEDARKDWHRALWEEAQHQFDAAEGSTPISAIHEWRARSKARTIFQARARDVLEYAFDRDTSHRDKEVSA